MIYQSIKELAVLDTGDDCNWLMVCESTLSTFERQLVLEGLGQRVYSVGVTAELVEQRGNIVRIRLVGEEYDMLAEEFPNAFKDMSN
jgi:hypothetical protein